MDLPRDSEFPADLSPLAWVQEELRRSLESVHKTLRRFLREADGRVSVLGVDAPASPPLLAAAAQLHQVAGVLVLVGLPGGATVLRAAETAVQNLAQQPLNIDLPTVETIERADFALLSFVARLLAGNKTSGLALFPPYRELQVLNGAERIHPADLWPQEFSWRELPADAAAKPLAPESVRRAFEATLLKQMRTPRPEHAGLLSELCAGLAAGLAASQARTLWQLAAAQYQAQAQGLLSPDTYAKRLGSRLLSQLRAGGSAASQRLAHDLLFFCAQAKAGDAAPRLTAVRQVYGLGEESGGDYEDDSLGRIDPAWVAQARRRVSLAKESWSSAAEGESHRLAGLDEQFAGLAESLSRLFPSGEVLGETLQRAVVATLRSGRPPRPDLAMEVATCMLYVEAALDDAAFDQPEQAERVRRLAQRVEAVSHGEPPAPLEAWMEELYRRVSDRQTLGSVVHELRASLSEVERLADEYFRNPSQRQVLIPVPGQLQSMRGVLTVLGLDQAAQATVRMRDEVDTLANTEVDPELTGPREVFERLANNLGALGFLIDMLSVQPQLAKRMFHFDETSGRLDAVMGRRSDAVSLPPLDSPAEPSLLSQVQAAAQAAAVGERPAEELARDLERLSQQARAADEPGLAHAAHSAQRLLDDAATLPMPLDLGQSAQDLAPVAAGELDTALAQAAQSLNEFLETRASAPVPVPAAEPLQLDEDMLPVFLEEAEEVFDNARAALAVLEKDNQDVEQLTTVRRAFHTLKGSSRMVGLNAFGEGAWACEQLYNSRIGDQSGADPALLAFTAEALDYLADWCASITSRQAGPHQPDGLRNSADALRLEGRVLPLDWPTSAAAPLAELEPEPELAAVPELPVLTDVEPAFDERVIDAAADDGPAEILPLPEVSDAAAAEPAEVPEAEDGGFVLDLPAPLEGELPASAADTTGFELPEFDLHLDLGEAEPSVETGSKLSLVTASEPELPTEEPAAPQEPLVEPEDSVKIIGPLRISITLFNIFLNEADELSRRLLTTLAEWAVELSVPVPANTEALAHALAGNAATVGFDDLSALARALEHGLGRAAQAGSYDESDAQLFVAAAEELRRLLHQFAAGFLKPVEGDLLVRLHDYQPAPAVLPDSAAMDLDLDPLPAAQDFAARAELAARDADSFVGGRPDDIDAELFPIFEEEAQDLLEQLHASLRDWLAAPQNRSRADACMRALHTFKGGARLSGAMGLGEQAHKLESSVEVLLAQPELQAVELRELQSQADALEASFEALRRQLAEPAAEPLPQEPVPIPVIVALPPEPQPLPIETLEVLEPQLSDAGPQVDWSRFTRPSMAPETDEPGSAATGQALVRVRGALLERMATQAGEVSIRRARLESELAQMKGALLDLDDNLDRLRSQLRELEVQAEGQMGSQQEAAKLAGRDFDPLEFDRYTRFQELTRMLAESVNDVATVQRSLQRNVQLGEDELAGQSRLTRELQDDLLRTRMVEFDASLAERLHRVVRQAARESGKQATLTIVGGHIELDRSVLERLTGAFEHLLRNSLSHGIETPEVRVAAGKPESGTITLRLAQEGNEVLLAFSDDGAGLNLARIRERGEMLGLIAQGAELEDSALMELIFAPGFSTASEVTALAGRGVGMDVVRAEVSTLGGYVDIHSTPGQGAGFDLRVPLTTALTQIVLLRYGEHKVAVPAALMESVQRLPLAQVEQAYGSASLKVGDSELPFYWLGGLMNHSGRGVLLGRTLPVVFIKSAQQRLALHVDEVLGNQEVVIKNLGPQLRAVPGLAGISLLASGDVALIYNPMVLSHWYGPAAQSHAQQAAASAASPLDAPEVLAPLVLVVDDSLTVRRVTQRLLEREGYRVQLAKDGMDAMEKLSGDELPAVVLSDIEMPRMDGFDLVRNMRADARLRELPVIMITSRIAQKHKDYAQELGVDHYLGKPYDEELLLDLIGRYTSSQIAVTQ